MFDINEKIQKYAALNDDEMDQVTGGSRATVQKNCAICGSRLHSTGKCPKKLPCAYCGGDHLSDACPTKGSADWTPIV